MKSTLLGLREKKKKSKFLSRSMTSSETGGYHDLHTASQ